MNPRGLHLLTGRSSYASAYYLLAILKIAVGMVGMNRPPGPCKTQSDNFDTLLTDHHLRPPHSHNEFRRPDKERMKRN